MPLKFIQGRQSVSTVNFCVNGVNLYNILVLTDYLNLKEADLTIDLHLHRQITLIRPV